MTVAAADATCLLQLAAASARSEGPPRSAVRYAPAAGAFFLWGLMNADYSCCKKSATMPVPEHDIWCRSIRMGVAKSPAQSLGSRVSKKLPPVFIPRTYSESHRQLDAACFGRRLAIPSRQRPT